MGHSLSNDLLYRSRICLLLTFGRDGALGTAHEPSVGRYTGYGSGLLYGELERLWHAQQDGTGLIACLAKHLIEVQRLAFCPSKSFLGLQRDHTAIMDAKLPDKVRLGRDIGVVTGAVVGTAIASRPYYPYGYYGYYAPPPPPPCPVVWNGYAWVSSCY